MDELIIERLERGYNVSIKHVGRMTNEYELERMACADRFDVVTEVLAWLGWDEAGGAEALDILDDTTYVLTDKARAALDAARPDERARLDSLRPIEWGRGDAMDAERRAERALAEAKRASVAAIRRTVEEQAGTRHDSGAGW